ncbi:MAG: glycosyltransferase family 2 protein [Frateuria sp.]|nr:glycosyltransferase family 2 protein [Frateuria sp.]
MHYLASPAPTTLSIVVPCFNEEAVLHATCERLCALRSALVAEGMISAQSDIVFVDDGSRDSTWEMIQAWVRHGAPVTGVKLSRNCGHQNALLAGLSNARGEAVVTIDADLQDDEQAIQAMVAAYQQGCEVVYGVRSRRDCDTWFKRTTARAFYRMVSALGVPLVFDHADYRLLSQRAIRYLDRFNEVNLFLRGVVPLLGLRSCIVHYERRPRLAGESKYPVRKMVEFALNGITSFSTVPLRAITVLGFSVSIGCVLLALWALAVRLASPDAVPGWASTTLPIYFLGGVQLFCVGVLGEYVGKIYLESKKRPRYLVETVSRREQAVAEIAALSPARLILRRPPAARLPSQDRRRRRQVDLRASHG